MIAANGGTDGHAKVRRTQIEQIHQIHADCSRMCEVAAVKETTGVRRSDRGAHASPAVICVNLMNLCPITPARPSVPPPGRRLGMPARPTLVSPGTPTRNVVESWSLI